MKLYYILFDLMLAILFFLIGIYFYKSNGKAANFLTGYNMKSIDERKKFNEDTRVKLPATIQFLRLGYDYISVSNYKKKNNHLDVCLIY